MAIVDKRNRSRADAPNPVRTRRPIGQDFSNEQVELGRIPQINSSAYAAPGRAISQVGDAVGDLLQGVNARAEKDAEFAASKAYAEYQNGTMQDFFDHEKSALPDGSDHTLNWQPKHEQRVQEFRSKVDDKRFQKYEANLVRNGGKFKLKAGEFETKRRYEYQSSELTKYLTPQLKILKAHPTEEGLATTREVSHNMVNSMDLTPEQKEQMKSTLDEKLIKTKLEGLIDIDPAKAISELDSQLATLEKPNEKQGKSIVNYSRKLDQIVPANRKDGKVADIKNLNPAFKNKLVQLQQKLGKNLIVNSGYRDPDRNRSVGGAKNSQHLSKNAVDLQWPKNATIQEKQQIIATAKSLGFKGFGIGNGILHLDTGRGRFWGYKNGKPTGNIPGWAVDALSGKVKASSTKVASTQTGGIQGKIAEIAQKEGVDPDYMINLAAAESSFRPGVKASTSSAKGLYQVTEGTAKNLGRAYGDKSVEQEILDGVSITKANIKTMTNYLGRPPENHELHLAHFLGAPVANKVLQADDGTPVSHVVTAGQLNANKKLFKTVKTVGQLKAFAQKKQTKSNYAPQGIDQSQEGFKAQLGQLRVRAEKALVKHQERQQENEMMQGVLTGRIKVSPHDTPFMKKYDKAFNNRFGADLNLLGDTPEAALGLQIAKAKAPFPKRIMQSLQGSMENPDPEVQLKAYQYADKLERANPTGFAAGTNGEKLGDKLAWFRRNAEFGGGINAIQRMNAMNERSAKMNKEQIKAEGIKLSKDLDENTHFESVFETEVLGWNAELPVTKRLQAQMMSEYKQLVMEGFSVHANADRAKAEAMRNISKIYGASEIDGTRRIMKYPPEGFIAPTEIEHVQEQLGEARQEAVTRAKPLIDAWRKQGWVPDGEPVIVSDEYTRRQADAWAQGATHEESVVMFPGTSAPMKTRSVPTWRFAIPVRREDGTKAVFKLDDRFAVDGLEQRKFDNDESVRARAKARFELKSEGELNQYYPHNMIRRTFGFENTEVQERIEESDPFK